MVRASIIHQLIALPPRDVPCHALASQCRHA